MALGLLILTFELLIYDYDGIFDLQTIQGH